MAKRRGTGEGSVYRRGDGRVVGEYVDANGKRRYISGKTKSGVQKRLREILADRDRGIAYDSENLTVGDFLDRWLDTVKGSVRLRTWQCSEEMVRLHLKPTIGHHRLEKPNGKLQEYRCATEGQARQLAQVLAPPDVAGASARP